MIMKLTLESFDIPHIPLVGKRQKKIQIHSYVRLFKGSGCAISLPLPYRQLRLLVLNRKKKLTLHALVLISFDLFVFILLTALCCIVYVLVKDKNWSGSGFRQTEKKRFDRPTNLLT